MYLSSLFIISKLCAKYDNFTIFIIVKIDSVNFLLINVKLIIKTEFLFKSQHSDWEWQLSIRILKTSGSPRYSPNKLFFFGSFELKKFSRFYLIKKLKGSLSWNLIFSLIAKLVLFLNVVFFYIWHFLYQKNCILLKLV